MSSTTTTAAAAAGNGGVQLLDAGPSKGYALSGKIMLSAIIVLFVVVVVMVCLHLYARWYLLRSRRRRRTLRNRNRRAHLVFYLDSDSTSDAANRGLDPSIVKSIPTFMYSEKEERESEEVPECAVCLSEFVEGERGRVLPKCGHSFHVECIDMWFHSHSTCPLCRAPVEAESAISDDAVVIEIVETESTRTESVLESERQGEEVVTGSDSAATDQVVAVPIWARRKKAAEIVGVSIEVPSRNDSVDSDELGSTSQAFRSPIQSLKRILSREKRPLSSPGTGTSRAPAMATVELESGNGRGEV